MQEEEKHGGSDEDGGVIGWFDDGGKGGDVRNNLPIIGSPYLNSNGANGWNASTGLFDIYKCAIGGNSVINNGTLTAGLGFNRGTGGDQHNNSDNDFAFECSHNNKGTSGVGGCLYILSADKYCVVNINVKDLNDAEIKVNVSNDGMRDIDDRVDDTNGTKGAPDEVTVGRIEKNGKLSFIVRKGATVSYTVSRDHYNTSTGSFVVGNTTSTSNLNVSAIDGNNEQTATIALSKRVFTHTITSSGASITVNGNLVRDNGSIEKYSATGTNSVTFKVWSGDPTVSCTVSKTHYNTLSNASITVGRNQTQTIGLTHGNAVVTTNGSNTTVSLPKTKYFVNNSNVRYAHSQNWGAYRWNRTGNLNRDDGEYDNAYMIGRKNATITISRVTGVPNNWIMNLDGCCADSLGSPRIRVTINGANRLGEMNISKGVRTDNNYTITGSGSTVNNIVIQFIGPSVYATNFYLDSVYFIIDD